MRVEIEREKCVTSGQCVLIAPEVFDQDEQGIVTVIDAEPSAEYAETVREAAAICPAAVIRLVESM